MTLEQNRLAWELFHLYEKAASDLDLEYGHTGWADRVAVVRARVEAAFGPDPDQSGHSEDAS